MSSVRAAPAASSRSVIYQSPKTGSTNMRKYPTTVYVSSHSGDSARELVAKLRADGHTVVSTWHDEPPIENWTTKAPDADRQAGADVNLRIISERTEVFVQIADPLVSGTGGKHVEMGYALGTQFPQTPKVVVYGTPENGMQYASGVKHVSDYPALLAVLDAYHVKGGPENATELAKPPSGG